jgi:hypothetical protein
MMRNDDKKTIRTALISSFIVIARSSDFKALPGAGQPNDDK